MRNDRDDLRRGAAQGPAAGGRTRGAKRRHARLLLSGEDEEEESTIVETGVGVYLSVTGSTAREHGLVVGEELFPNETALMENYEETGGGQAREGPVRPDRDQDGDLLSRVSARSRPVLY